MDIFTLNSNFQRQEIIEETTAAIWTERYSQPGDFQLVTKASPAMQSLLQENTFIETEDSLEVGIIETANVEDGQLTVSGKFLTDFLKNRVVRSTRVHETRYWELVGTPGWIAGEIVRQMCCAGGLVTTSPNPVPGGVRNVISGLSVGSTASGTSVTHAVSFGTVLDAVKAICDTDDVGYRMRLASKGSSDLIFETYKGVDRTSSGQANPVFFESALDSLVKTKELRSIENYRNACFAYSPSLDPQDYFGSWVVGQAFVDGGNTSTNFNRRAMMIFVEDITTDELGGSISKLTAVLTQRAKDALANNNYVRMLDGEIVPQVMFTYDVDYTLGDIIELRSSSDVVQKARITEYIRTKDVTGSRAYPTLSVITD